MADAPDVPTNDPAQQTQGIGPPLSAMPPPAIVGTPQAMEQPAQLGLSDPSTVSPAVSVPTPEITAPAAEVDQHPLSSVPGVNIGTPSSTVPNPMVESTQTAITAGTPLKKGTLEALNAAEKESAYGITGQANAEEKQAQAELAARQSAAIQAQRDQADAALRKQQIDAETRFQMQKYQAMVSDYSQQHVDPDALWKKVGTGGRVVGAIAQALGAFGSALTHTPNYAAESIKTMVDNNIAAQRAEIEKKGTAIGLQHNVVAHFMQQGIDADHAALLAEQVLRNNLNDQIMIGAAANKGALAQASAQRLMGENLKSNALTQNALAQSTQAKVERTFAQKPLMTSAEMLDQQRKQNALMVPTDQVNPKTGKKVILTGADEKAAGELRDFMAAKASLTQMANSIAEMTRGQHVVGENKQKIDDTYHAMYEIYKNLDGKGIRPAEWDKDILKPFRDPNQFFKDDKTTRAAIQGFLDRLSVQGHNYQKDKTVEGIEGTW